MCKMENKQIKSKWTKDLVIKEIKSRLERGLSLSPAEMKKDGLMIMKHGKKLFGGWSNALTAAELDYNDWYSRKPRGYWTKEKIVEELLKRREEGKSLNEIEVDNENASLIGATKREFGAWSNALSAIGENPSDHFKKKQRVKSKWTEEGVLIELQLRKDNGLSLKTKDVTTANRGLYTCAIKYFGNWKEVIKQLK